MIKPLNDIIIVERVEVKKGEQVTDGGIILPGQEVKKDDLPCQGKVVAVGPGLKDSEGKRIEVDVNVGDEILFEKYAGSQVEIKGETFIRMRETEVIGIL